MSKNAENSWPWFSKEINGCVSLKTLPRSSHLGFSSERQILGGKKKFQESNKKENKITKHFRNFRSQLKGFLVEELDVFSSTFSPFDSINLPWHVHICMKPFAFQFLRMGVFPAVLCCHSQEMLVCSRWQKKKEGGNWSPTRFHSLMPMSSGAMKVVKITFKSITRAQLLSLGTLHGINCCLSYKYVRVQVDKITVNAINTRSFQN